VVRCANSGNYAVYKRYFGLRARDEATDMGQKDACGDLADVSTLTTHVRSRDDLQVRLIRHHPAIVGDAAGWVLHLYQWVPTLDQFELLLVVHLGSYILVVA